MTIHVQAEDSTNGCGRETPSSQRLHLALDGSKASRITFYMSESIREEDEKAIIPKRRSCIISYILKYLNDLSKSQCLCFSSFANDNVLYIA